MVAACVLAVALAIPYELFAEAAGHRYGRIMIVGNVHTPDRVILGGFVPLRPGQKIAADDVRTARVKLRASGLFSSTAVELIPNEFDSAFDDLRVSVGDRVVNRYVFSLPVETVWVASRLSEALAESIGMGTRDLLSIVEKLSRATPRNAHAPWFAADTEFHATLGRIRRFQLQLVHLRRVETNPANHRLSSTGYLSEVDRM